MARGALDLVDRHEVDQLDAIAAVRTMNLDRLRLVHHQSIARRLVRRRQKVFPFRFRVAGQQPFDLGAQLRVGGAPRLEQAPADPSGARGKASLNSS